MAQLFDTNDERRLFQLLVPKRALQCPPLLHAICAVSARRLARHPRYNTPQGIHYQSHLVDTLDSTTAVEYMLKCIPYLFEFHNATDETYQENIIAAAVILRQYEEMDEELDNPSGPQANTPSITDQRTNFLAITQGIIDSCASFPTFARETLAHAAFWIAVRQEVYESFMREEAPKMTFDKYHFGPVSTANRLVMHAAEVTRWNWGPKTDEEWTDYKRTGRLNAEQQLFAQIYASEFIPIYHHPADGTSPSVFPTVWYASDAQVVSVQHFELARMILVAEKPASSSSRATSRAMSRAAQRKIESLVRSIILKLCGIAFSNPACLPALVSATMAISLYGDYFTDERERACLLRVFERMEEAHVWPVYRKRREVVEKWRMVDSL
ncbi:hypothetical protein N0V90_009666 [Kalmusia sp. IMI 367209]|nr:hypothetical protein N0V90_009666 [Kalmusia sp. IMI 367209]